MTTAAILSAVLLLFPVPEMLRAAGIVQLPLSLLYNQAIINAAADTGAFVLLALGLNVVVGYAGLLDLGYAAFFAVGTYTYAILASSVDRTLIISGVHIPFWIMLIVSALVTAGFGVAFGAPTLRLRGDYLAIVTLGFGEIVPNFILNLDMLTGGTNGIAGVDKPAIPLTNYVIGGPTGNDNISFYYLALVLVVFIIFVVNRLRDSRIGRAWMAIREDELAAATMGINTTTTKLLAFGLGAAVAGFAGTFYCAHLSFASPQQFNFSQSVLILCMVILGGMGNMWGVILGAIILYMLQTVFLIQLPNWLHEIGGSLKFQPLIDFSNNVHLTDYTFFIYGTILVLFMLFRPEGLLPSSRRREELHPEATKITEQERGDLYDVREGQEIESDIRGGV
jgi:branched-chain amino acid transport system permease protein